MSKSKRQPERHKSNAMVRLTPKAAATLAKIVSVTRRQKTTEVEIALEKHLKTLSGISPS
jgi:hypothetical protein